MVQEQTGSELSTALFFSARSGLTSWGPTYYTPLVKPIQGLILAYSGQAGPIHEHAGTGPGSRLGLFLIWSHYRDFSYSPRLIVDPTLQSNWLIACLYMGKKLTSLSIATALSNFTKKDFGFS